MKRILTPLAVAALALSLAACGSDSDSDDEGALVSAGKLTVCSDLPYAPFEYEDAESPSGYSGFDIDIVQYIADELEVDLEVVPTSFTPIQGGTALNAKQCDIGASAITIDDVRAEKLSFSDPYFDSEQSLLVPKGSSIKTIADLKGKSVGVQADTTGEDYAADNAKDAEQVAFPDDGKMFQALKAKTVDALLQDIGVNALHASDGDYEIVETYPTKEQYGLAIRKGNDELLDDVNEALQEMRDSGEYQKTYDKYFG